MNLKTNNSWLCFKTNSREEFVAKNYLVSKGFNVLLPYYIKKVTHARKQLKVRRPMFPSYGFLEYDGKLSSLYEVKYSRGVSHYLQNQDGYPQFVPANVIEAIKLLKQEDGSFKLDPNRFKIGDEVNIIEGVFTGIKAIFKEQVDEFRSRLLISLLGRISEIGITTQMIEKA